MEINNIQEVHKLALELAERLGVEVGQPFRWIEDDHWYSVLSDGRIKSRTFGNALVRELTPFERMLLSPEVVVKQEGVSPESKDLAQGLMKIWPEGELVRQGGLELRVQGEIRALLPEGLFREVKDRMRLEDMCRMWDWTDERKNGGGE